MRAIPKEVCDQDENAVGKKGSRWLFIRARDEGMIVAYELVMLSAR